MRINIIAEITQITAVILLAVAICVSGGCYTKQNIRATKTDSREDLAHSKGAEPSSGCDKAKAIIKASGKLSSPIKKRKQIEQAVALCPDVDVPHLALAMALESEQDPKKKNPDYSSAEAEYRKTLKINPSNTKALFRLAGIEYITGRFDSAAVHYRKFLGLDKNKENNQDTRQAAERLMIKCGWLSTLPPNSLDLKSLRVDPDRYSGAAELVGDIAFELGKAATDVTGKLGYQAAGTGIWIGAQLLGGSKIETFDWIESVIKKKNYSKLYTKSLKNLPKAVNKKGVNSQDVSILVMGVFLGGRELKKESNLKELTPFAWAVINDIDTKAAESKRYGLFLYLAHKTLAVPRVCETLGDVVINQNPKQASVNYKLGLRNLNERYPLPADQRAFDNDGILTMDVICRTKLILQYKASLTDSKNPSLEEESLQSLIELYQEAQHYGKDYNVLKNKIGGGFIAWSANRRRMNNRNADALKTYADFVETLQLSEKSGPEVFNVFLGWALALNSWGERDRAIKTIEQLKMVSPNFRGIIAGDKIAALVYRNSERSELAK